ncbi:MAG: site-specific DNA-methyltransferase [Ectothiorhodospiraceae bacterium AqS1]|nr:site-specific DNA-methyltransferase [Ectothiorhodospiraceae bacterium AqS1]
MPHVKDETVALTMTSPPYWDAIDYDLHAQKGSGIWYRSRGYKECGDSYGQWLDQIEQNFAEVLRTTIKGGFCVVVMGTILKDKLHYPAPFDFISRMVAMGWLFHQDIVWNKVTGGVKRAGVYIQHPGAGYYYPNIMTEYILVFRKEGPVRRDKRLALPIDEVFKKDIANNIWHIAPVPPNTINHPCPFPVELVRRVILLYSQKGDDVLDPFLGSGQTAKVALNLGRNAVGYEIEKGYIDTAVKGLRDVKQRKYQLIPHFTKMRNVMSSKYEKERKVFEELKRNCTADLRNEFKQAVAYVLETYNTTIRENRFVAGGAIEIFVSAMLTAAGLGCQINRGGA